jgi:hypothetical protein
VKAARGEGEEHIGESFLAEEYPITTKAEIIWDLRDYR